jgi:hypothetical protein
MITPANLKQPSQLPDDLKALLAELQVPVTDPVLPLLAWIWKQMLDTKGTLESARASAAAIFDNRLERMNKTAELLISVDESLQQVDEQLRASRFKSRNRLKRNWPNRSARRSNHAASSISR